MSDPTRPQGASPLHSRDPLLPASARGPAAGPVASAAPDTTPTVPDQVPLVVVPGTGSEPVAGEPLEMVLPSLRASGWDSEDLQVMFEGIDRRYGTDYLGELAGLAHSHPDPRVRHACDLTIDTLPPAAVEVAGATAGPEVSRPFEVVDAEQVGLTAEVDLAGEVAVTEVPGWSTPDCVAELNAAVTAASPAPGPGALADGVALDRGEWWEVRAVYPEPTQLSPGSEPVTMWTDAFPPGRAPEVARLATEGTAVVGEVLVEGRTAAAFVNPGGFPPPTVDQLQQVTVGLVDLDPLPGLDAAAQRPAASTSIPHPAPTEAPTAKPRCRP